MVTNLSIAPPCQRRFLTLTPPPPATIAFPFSRSSAIYSAETMPNWELKDCCKHDQTAFLVTIGVFTLVILASHTLWLCNYFLCRCSEDFVSLTSTLTCHRRSSGRASHAACSPPTYSDAAAPARRVSTIVVACATAGPLGCPCTPSTVHHRCFSVFSRRVAPASRPRRTTAHPSRRSACSTPPLRRSAAPPASARRRRRRPCAVPLLLHSCSKIPPAIHPCLHSRLRRAFCRASQPSRACVGSSLSAVERRLHSRRASTLAVPPLPS
ncbi:hypothetical protein U1Q18_038755 [Sarracenia purpurea var. burkii]